MAGDFDFIIEQGAEWSAVLTWQTNGSAVDLTGSTAHMTFSDGTVLSVGSGLTLGGAAGTITVRISSSVTASMKPGVNSYKLDVTDSGGSTKRIIKGTASVMRDVVAP